MALIDDINNLPATVSDGIPGHLNNHQVIHAALKDHETRIGVGHLVGTGFPEGQTSAPIGTQYTDTAATNGAIRWVKTSGTGRTGWEVEYGDTGWRDISSYIVDRSTPIEFSEGSGIHIRRVQDTVQFRIFGETSIPSQFGKLSDNFDGFRPRLDWQVYAISRYADLKVGVWQIRIENGVRGERLCPAGESRLVQWDTYQNWPSTLPGVPS